MKALGANVNVWEDVSGGLHWSYDLLEPEAFRSLAASLRLVYMEKEPAHFHSVCKILKRYGPEIRGSVIEISKAFGTSLAMDAGGFNLVTKTGTQRVRHKEILEAWMYGEMFHQKPKQQELLNLLRKHPAEFQFHLQATVMLLCGLVLSLDDLIADFLQAPRKPRTTKRAKTRLPPQSALISVTKQAEHAPEQGTYGASIPRLGEEEPS